MERTGMTLHEFSKKSGIPRSTLWSLEKKEDYDVRESNIRKIAQGMGVPPSALFDDADSDFCLNERSEIWIIKKFRGLSDRQKGRLEGYIKALTEENDDTYQSNR